MQNENNGALEIITLIQYKIWLVIAIITSMNIISISNLYGQDRQEKIGGELTPNIAWKIDDNTIYISGIDTIPTRHILGKSAWYNYRSLFQTVVIEEGITYVGQHIFLGYKNINSISLAESVKFIAPYAFYCGNKNLLIVEVKSATPPDISFSSFYKIGKNAKLIVPAGSKSQYLADPLWSQFVSIEESTKPAEIQPTSAEILSTPCTINLTRTAHQFGAALKATIILNGVEIGKLINQKSMAFTTDRTKNELIIKSGKKVMAVRRFNATAGDEISIEFSMYL